MSWSLLLGLHLFWLGRSAAMVREGGLWNFGRHFLMLVAYSSRSELQGVTAVDGAVAIAHETILDTESFNIWAALL